MGLSRRPGARHRASAGLPPLRSVNPASGAEILRYPQTTDGVLRERLDRAVREFAGWRARPFGERAGVLRAVAGRLRSDRTRWASLMAAEMGKPVRQGEAEAEKCARVCEYYADHAASFLADEAVESEAARTLVRYDPMGVLLAVMPWNFPLWQVFRAAAPSLMAGNVLVLKHASNVSGCALAIEGMFRDAGAPDGLVQTLLISGSRVEKLVRDPRVAAVTLTGGIGAGVPIATAAGSVLKKVVLELGGSDPFVVLSDADVDRAAEVAVRARCINSGQSCIAAKRFLVVADVYERFLTRFVAGMTAMRVGDPREPMTEIGPLATAELVATVERQVRASVDRGARIETGGAPIDGPGQYYPPTVLTGVSPGMPAFDEEVFGPVAAVTRARDDAEAIALANQSRFGLGASVWVGRPSRALAIADQIDAGMVFVNEMVVSDPRLPFGGRKESGIGRELGRLGIHEFVSPKTIWLAP